MSKCKECNESNYDEWWACANCNELVNIKEQEAKDKDLFTKGFEMAREQVGKESMGNLNWSEDKYSTASEAWEDFKKESNE